MARISPRWRSVLALDLATGTALPAWACTTCGRTLSADGAMGYSVGTGWRINFEYDYIDQDELRNLDGYQLFPHWTAAVGVNYAL